MTIIRMVTVGAMASALVCRGGIWHGPTKRRRPDFSGHCGKGRASISRRQKKAGPDRSTNASKDIQQPEGDYKNPILQPWAAAIVKKWAEETHAGRAPAHAHALCYPTSLPGVMTLHNAYQFLQEAGEGDDHHRQPDAGPAHLSERAAFQRRWSPSWYGESVGHYEGDTLVVDTIGIKTKDVVPLDRFGTPHTEKLHVVERIRKTGPKELRIDYHIEDPGAFTTPWDASLTFRPFKEEWGEDPCSENNIDVTGKLLPGLPVDEHPAF